MWELGHKEGWVLKNWCFQIVVLEKILESPLDCKEIQRVNPKGNQSLIFNDAEWFSSVQLLSPVWLFATPWTAAHQASLSITNPGVYPNSCPLSQWCYLTISSSVSPFSFWPQSCPASGSFTMSWLFASGGQRLELQFQHQSFQWIFRVDFL